MLIIAKFEDSIFSFRNSLKAPVFALTPATFLSPCRLVYCVCLRLQSDTDQGDTSRSQETAELMDLSQASQRQANLASNRMKNKGNEFKRDSPLSSFGPRRNKRRKGSKLLTSHLIYTTSSIHHLWQSKSPFFHPPKGE